MNSDSSPEEPKSCNENTCNEEPCAEKKTSPLRKLYDWTLTWAERPGGSWALFWLAFVESSFFPIPPDVLLLALATGKPKHSWRFAAICTIGSVLGGIAGWGIGKFAWGMMEKYFIPHVFSQEKFAEIGQLFVDTSFWTITTAALTPIPYKVFTIAAGVFEASLLVLIIASILGRGLRFFTIGGIMYWLGAPARKLIEKYFDRFAWIGLILILIAAVLWKLLH